MTNVIMKSVIVLFLILLLTPSLLFANEKVFFYHTDAAGTPVVMTDQSGDVVWEADYKPFGEEYEVTGHPDNKNRFIGKEKDEETGLHYFGARYLDTGIGRFTKPDPVGIRESDLLNPQRFNRYNYSLNNPYRYVDPNGEWAEEVHSGIGRSDYGTYKWAKDIGFSSSEARIIARGNNATDFGPGTSFMPFLTGGDQTRHFNKQYISMDSDSRDFWAAWEYKKAIELAQKGNMEAALAHLGKGLHSLQDKYAHRDWDTGITGRKRHPEWYDFWDDIRNKEAAKKTREISLDYLKKFHENIKE